MTSVENNQQLTGTLNTNSLDVLDESSCDTIQETVCILGGGVGGSFAALELAAIKNPDGTPRYKIKLIDKNPEILLGSSNITPGRMGLGFHYVHRPTALMYLKATIEFQKTYSKIKDFRIGADQTDVSIKRNLQHGRYFITKDSTPSAAEILATYKYIQEEYRKLVLEDQTNKVFGEPEDFFRILKPEEYQHYIHTDNIEIGVETAECLLNWPKFRKFVISQLKQNPNIEIETNVTANKITPNKDNLNYTIELLEDNGVTQDKKEYLADTVINCTWENVRSLNATAGLDNPNIRTNRLKALIIVKLPDSLKDTPSAFFCMGPHAMYSNLGDGLAAMTFAPVTSMFNSTDVEVPEKINRYLQGKASLEEKMKIGNAIRTGVAKYIKGIEHAEIQEVRFGIVQTDGEVDIYDHNSAFSRRDYNGIKKEKLFNFVSNPCMKLLYGPENGGMVKDIIVENYSEIKAMRKFHASVEAFAQTKYGEDKVKKSDLNLLRHATLRPMLKREIVHFDKDKLKKVPDPTSNSINLGKVVENPSKIKINTKQTLVQRFNSNPLLFNENTPLAINLIRTQNVSMFAKLIDKTSQFFGNYCCFFSFSKQQPHNKQQSQATKIETKLAPSSSNYTNLPK